MKHLQRIINTCMLSKLKTLAMPCFALFGGRVNPSSCDSFEEVNKSVIVDLFRDSRSVEFLKAPDNAMAELSWIIRCVWVTSVDTLQARLYRRPTENPLVRHDDDVEKNFIAKNNVVILRQSRKMRTIVELDYFVTTVPCNDEKTSYIRQRKLVAT